MNKIINEIEYAVEITTAENFSSSTVLLTIPVDGSDAVKKYRLNLSHQNPENQRLFLNLEDIELFIETARENYFSLYFDDPVEEESI
jgi:hypothetical protein